MFARSGRNRLSKAMPAAAVSVIFAATLASVFSGCSPGLDPANGLGKRAILDSAKLSLTKSDCTSAIALLKPVYDSVNTDNNVRMLMASSYGCSAKINFFTVIGHLLDNVGSFTGSGFWEFLAKEFPSSTLDRVTESAQLAQDALQSSINPGAVVLPANLYNTTTFNPGTLSSVDRTSDANSYLFFVSMAAIGGFENRYGSPFPNGKKSVDLPWTVPTAVDADGCAYASAVVNFVDSLGGLADATVGSVSTTFATLKTTFQAGIYAACDSGCFTLCGLAHCATCPTALRNRVSCTGLATDAATCAAVGITLFMNSTPVVGWATGP